MTNQSNSQDNKTFSRFDYLEQVEGSEALAFAHKNNASTDTRLKTDARYQKAYDEILEIVSDKDKLPAFFIINNEIYNFWQDDVHIKGLLRKSTMALFNAKKPDWQTVLDLDLLAQNEKENWVYKGIQCFDPENELCMLSLSRGGKDAHVLREFNLRLGDFVKNGFYIPESKSDIAWVDRDTLMLSDATEGAPLTTSGYPSQIKVLKRNQSLQEAQLIYSCGLECMGVWTWSKTSESKRFVFINHQLSFYESETYLFDLNTLKLQKIPIPKSSHVVELYKGMIVFINRKNLDQYAAGSLLSFAFNEITADQPILKPIFTPSKVNFLENAVFSQNHIWVNSLNDVKKQVAKATYTDGQWKLDSFSLGDANGNSGALIADDNSHDVYFSYTDFLTPTSVYHFNESQAGTAKIVLQSPSHFHAEGFKVEQHKVKSKDGTLIPYFVVYPKNMKLNSKNPVLLYGYGGFEVALTPAYLGSTGKAWLEKGGVYVLANIRGGGEYGPDWHSSVLLDKRHKVYEDFYAIAEDLIHRQITSPRHLGIRGGSNGGLLTSVAFTQRPDLFNAVISEVPLANMMEYHHWLAGASWMDEYGNPDDEKMQDYLLSYSPLHNLQAGKNYPEVFYLTSTKDDRVHPGHARQMVARLQELGYPVLYNENTNGGHGRASNMKDLAEFLALEFTYLYQKLF